MASYNTISYGSRGDEVLDLQKKLNAAGYTVDEDGIFGNQTQTALKKYQTDKKLTADGIAGQQTWDSFGSTEAAPEVPKVPAEKTGSEKAQEILDQLTATKPGPFQSQWTEQVGSLTDQVLNEKPFTYDINGDVLLQQAQDRYLQQGKMAMLDTMGEAAALTGGYGNTYGQQVGQQTYQGYLQGINDMIPEFYDRAKADHDQESADLRERLSLVAGLEAQDYDRHRAEQEAWMAERDYLTGRYDTERGFEYQKEQDKIAQDQWERQFAASQKASSGGGGGYYRSAGPSYDEIPQSLINQLHEAASLGDQDELSLLAEQLNWGNYDPEKVYRIMQAYGITHTVYGTGNMPEQAFINLSGQVRNYAFRGDRYTAEKLIRSNASLLSDLQIKMLYNALDDI